MRDPLFQERVERYDLVSHKEHVYLDDPTSPEGLLEIMDVVLATHDSGDQEPYVSVYPSCTDQIPCLYLDISRGYYYIRLTNLPLNQELLYMIAAKIFQILNIQCDLNKRILHTIF